MQKEEIIFNLKIGISFLFDLWSSFQNSFEMILNKDKTKEKEERTKRRSYK